MIRGAANVVVINYLIVVAFLWRQMARKMCDIAVKAKVCPQLVHALE